MTRPSSRAGRHRPPAAGTADPGLLRARTAVITTFVLSGLVVSTLLSRIPYLRDQLGLSPGQLGRLLLVVAAGAVLALPTSGAVVNRIGARWTVALGAGLAAAGIALIGIAAGSLASVVLVAAGMFAAGYGAGAWDVAMNVEGAVVERRLRRAIMPRLHAGFSLGTVTGAGLGALAAATRLPLALHFGAVALLTITAALVACRSFLPAAGTAAVPQDGGAARPRVWEAWREPRTLLVGVLVLTWALAEGIANDWLAVALVDGFQVSNATGAAGYAVFVTAMTVFRMWGTLAIDRFGRVPVLRASAALVVVGVLLVVLGGALPVAFAGVVVWGAGAALGFPLGMSAAADDPVRAAARVSVVASIGYTAFLAGPPVLGWLGDHFGTHRALLFVLAAAVAGALVAGAARPPRHQPAAPPATSSASDPAVPTMSGTSRGEV